MSEPKDDGGHAFPFNGHDWATEGMSLRVWIAAQMLPAVWTQADGDTTLEDIARRCYAMADAMLEARKK